MCTKNNQLSTTILRDYTVNHELKIYHEIKNSISILECTLNLMAKSHPEMTSYEFWDDLIHEFQYLHNMIGGFSKSQTPTLNLQPYSVKSIVSSVNRTLRPITEQSGFTCKFSMADDLPAFYADADRLKSSLINIIKNAYEAMNQSGTVFVNILEDNGYIRMDIQDFGGGIAKEQEAHIFEAYYTNKENGTGLGLPITKQFITEMGGSISCTSRPGDGCTFTLLLPVFSEDKHSV